MEGNILKGPKFEWLWLAEPKHKRRVADSMRQRELARIATAGGKLSTRAQAALTRLTSNLEHAATRVSVVDGLQQESWSGWGRMGDASVEIEQGGFQPGRIGSDGEIDGDRRLADSAFLSNERYCLHTCTCSRMHL